MTNAPSQKHDDGYRPGSDPPVISAPNALQGEPCSHDTKHNSKDRTAILAPEEVHKSQIDNSTSCINVNAQYVAAVGSKNVNAVPRFNPRVPHSMEPMAHGGEHGVGVNNTVSYLTNTRPPELGGGSAATTQPTGNQAIPELRMLPPAQLHIPLRFLADDIGHFYLDREEMGLIQIERPLSRITTRRDYPRVMCVATLVALGLALVTFVGAIIQKTLF